MLVEPENRGHTAASTLGAATLAAEGAAGMVQLPADLPLVTPADIAALLQAHGEAPSITLAPSRDRLGSNAVACSPPDLLPLRFGDDSFFPHLERARALGVEPAIVERPGLALDVDTPADLAAFLAAPSATRAYAYLAQSGIAARRQFDRLIARVAGSAASRYRFDACQPGPDPGRSRRSCRPASCLAAWSERERFAPDDRVIVWIEPEDQLARAASLQQLMDIIGRRAEARGLTPKKLADLTA